MNNRDLISREALLKKYCKEPANGDCKNCDWFGDSWCRCEIFGVQIAEATAVDAVEVVHGRWVAEKVGNFRCVRCSACGKDYAYDYGMLQVQDFHHCPNCGARMDGE